MTKTTITKAIVRAYFIGAIAGSFSHLVTAAHKGGLVGWEAWSVPFMIDGIAILGLVMRSEDFSKRTRKIGFRTQCVAGLLSLTGNVFAAHNIGGAIYGVGIVALFLFAEWLSGNMESVKVDQEAETTARRKAAAAKATATRRRNAAKARQEVKVLEGMLKR